MEEALLVVEADEAGMRLDVFVARRLQLSRAQTRRLLEQNVLQLDGTPVDESSKGIALAAGSHIAIHEFVHPRDFQVPVEPDAPLRVLAEGEDWLCVDKPAGQPVHPLQPDELGTLLGAVAGRYPQLQGVGEGGLRSGVAHRLDVDTSGALLVALIQRRWEGLREAFRTNQVEKIYRAIVIGHPPDAGELELALAMAAHKPARVKVVEPPERGARPTRLAWRVLERFHAASLVEVRLETGFLHQIRVSFAHLGCPVAGDKVYGLQPDPLEAPRHMLHCARLAVDEIAGASPDPDDFELLLARLREDQRGEGSA